MNDSSRNSRAQNIQGGRLLKWKGRIVSAAPGALLASVSAIALSIAPVLADPVGLTEDITADLRSQQILESNVDLAITDIGEIRIRDSAGAALTIDPDYSSTFINDGTILIRGNASTATGLRLNGDLLQGGTLSNTGSISLKVTEETPDLVYGINVMGAVAGTIDNSGTIEVNALATNSNASAWGIYVLDDIEETGQILNSGTITVVARATSAAAAGTEVEAYGIKGNGLLAGLINNSGTINAYSFSNDVDTASAWGIYVDGGVAETGQILNSGTITVEAEAKDIEAQAEGISVNGSFAGLIDNSGTIKADAFSYDDDATAWGIYVTSDIEKTGQILNSGTITAIAESTGDDAKAYGIRVSDVAGLIDNSGTIEAYASSGDDDASAWGIYVSSDVAETGQILNSGTITVEASNDTQDSAEAHGIEVNGSLAGLIDNSGTIEVYASAHADDDDPDKFYASAYGIHVDGEVADGASILNSGTIIAEATINGASDISHSAYAAGMLLNSDVAGYVENSGTIKATATSEAGNSAAATGFYIEGEVSGTVVNSGMMTLSAFQDYSNAYASGFYIDGVVSGEVVNSGTIKAVANSASWVADAYGINVVDKVEDGASILNSGTITADAIVETGTYVSAFAGGIWLEAGVAGDVENSGTIKATAESSGLASASGFYIEGEVSGTVVNSGTISATATAYILEASSSSSFTAGAGAYGFYLKDSVAGDVVNSGTITATATSEATALLEYSSEYGSALAVGILMGGELTGSLTNSGTITATAERSGSSGSANALGINIIADVAVGAKVLNSGTISATAIGSPRASAYGLSIDAGYFETVTVYGDIVNSGAINATASGDGSSAAAYGVFVDNLDGTFANSGVITASVVSDTGESSTYGVRFNNFNGEITDLGTINVSGADIEYAVYLGTGTGTMNVDTEDNVDALMRVEDHNVNLDAVGGSRVFRFEDKNTEAGTFTKLITDPTSAWFVEDENGDMPIYVAVDSDDVTVNANAVAALGAQLGAFSDQLVGGADVFSSSKTSLLGGALRPFASVGGQHIGYDTTSTAAAMDVNIANVTVGMSGTMGNGMDVAFGFGAFNASADTAATDLDAEGFYLGGSVGQSFGAFDLNAGLGFGLLASDLERTVSGETASSSFDSNFFTAHVGAERGFQMSNGLNLTGYGQVRFTRQNDDGYTETGSSANLTVGDMATDVTEFTLGAEVSKTMDSGGIISAHATAISRNVSGDSEVSVSLFGQDANIQSSNSDYSGLNVGFGYETEILESAVLNVAIDHDLGDNGSGPNLSAGMTWNF
jgi:cytoskeletal protein CcmA (bactofilin family)